MCDAGDTVLAKRLSKWAKNATYRSKVSKPGIQSMLNKNIPPPPPPPPPSLFLYPPLTCCENLRNLSDEQMNISYELHLADKRAMVKSQLLIDDPPMSSIWWIKLNSGGMRSVGFKFIIAKKRIKARLIPEMWLKQLHARGEVKWFEDNIGLAFFWTECIPNGMNLATDRRNKTLDSTKHIAALRQVNDHMKSDDYHASVNHKEHLAVMHFMTMSYHTVTSGYALATFVVKNSFSPTSSSVCRMVLKSGCSYMCK